MEIKRMNKFIKALLISILTFEDNPSLSCTPKDKDHWNDQAPLQLPNELTCPLNGKGPFQVTWDKLQHMDVWPTFARKQKMKQNNECYRLTKMSIANIFGTPHSGDSIQLCKPKHQCYFSVFHQNSRTKYCKILVQVPWILHQLHILFHAIKGRRETISKGSIYNLHPLSLCMCRESTFVIKHE